ncbi:MAG TPA: LCP family protein, partial [Coriobacteriia bacterium]
MGKHIKRSGPSAGRPAARKAPQQIRRLDPTSSTRETPQQATRRQRESSRMVDPRVRLRRRRRRLMTSLVVLLLLIFGTAALAFGYLNQLNAQIHPVDWAGQEDPLTKLAPSNTSIVTEPFYMVLIGVDTRPEEKVARSDSLMLARVDPQGQRVQIMSIPRDTRVTIKGRGKAKINEAMQRGGPALVIETVRDFTGLPISHYVVVDFNGFKGIVDAMGGVRIYVPEKIDDIQAANNHPDAAVIPKGWNTLDGQHALTFVRARHQFADQDFTRVKNQQAFVKALYKQAMSITNPFKIPVLISAVASSMKTDLQLADIASLARVFKGMPDRNIETITMPGDAKTIDGASVVVADEKALHEVIRRMEKGISLSGTETTGTLAPTQGLKPADITVSVRNGAGVSGLAKSAQDKLIADGFKVTETGNMNQFVYAKTLVVFKDQDMKATMVRESLGMGDLVASR